MPGILLKLFIHCSDQSYHFRNLGKYLNTKKIEVISVVSHTMVS